MKKKVTIIIPVFNEQDNIQPLYKAIEKVFYGLSYDYNIIFIDDGSSDATLDMIKSIADFTLNVQFISFSRNFGHQSALKAGIDMSESDCVISMDGDMQHPPELIPRFLKKWENGYDVVYTIRQEDAALSYQKRKISSFFYTFLNYLSDVNIEKGTADFRLLSRNVVEIIKNLDDCDLFLRGMVKWIGFKQYAIEYEPMPRSSGVTKYSFKKMMRLALNGITSFSDKPLHIAAYLGLVFSLLSVLYLPYAIGSYLLGYAISGWTSVIVTISFFGGLQLMILGIIGIYLGKLFMQSKRRPLYITKESNIVCKEKIETMSF